MKFFKTLVTFEVLSADAPFDGSASDLAIAITTGDMSGIQLPTQVTELSAAQMSEALIEQGSDPAFLLGEDGEEDAEGEA